jgi:protein tyrosine/serine phosphatase
MWRTLARFVAVVIIVVLIVGPVLIYSHFEAQTRNFRIVTDGVLYRSAQMPLDGLKRIIHDYNIRTVISLRDAMKLGDPPPDLQEEEYCTKMGLTHVRLRPAMWWAPSGRPPADANVARFRKIMDDPANYPVLVHCFAGIHRTGAYCAVYRMEYEGWSNGKAIEEMKTLGYGAPEEDIQGYLESYVPTWRRAGLEAPPPFEKRAVGRSRP